MKVLIADDDSSTRMILSSLVRKLGHEPHVASDGKEAWDAYRRQRVPLVVTDWLMPGMSGVELCTRIRTDYRDPRMGEFQPQDCSYTRVIIVTALSSRERVIEGFQAGADDFLVKPIDVDALAARIKVAERAHAHEEVHMEAAIRTVLNTLQAELGVEHSALLDSLNQLVAIYRSQRNYAKARAFLRRQIQIATRTFGSNHTNVQNLHQQLEELQRGSERPGTRNSPFGSIRVR